MHVSFIRACAVFVVLATVSCDRPANDSDSLVNANDLPPTKSLSGEIIQINRSSADAYSNPREDHSLSYELRPDNTLTVTHSRGGYQGQVLGKEASRLPTELANRVRTMLRRIRPDKLKGVEYVTLPSGCEPQSVHDFPEVTIAFINEGSGAGVEDDQVGIFGLPYTHSCKNMHATRARELLRQVLQTLPRSKVAASYIQTR